MLNYKIRKLDENDYDNYLILINMFRQSYFTKDQFRNVLKNLNNNDIWIIEMDNKIIATGTILYETKFIHNICKLAHLEDICIHEEYRSKKFGIILMKHLINESKKNNCYKISLYCKEDLENFYKKVGFQKNNIEMNLYLKNIQ